MAKRKRFWKQKTFWTGIGLVGFGVTLCTQKKWMEGVQAVMGGLSIIFLRQAVQSGDQ